MTKNSCFPEHLFLAPITTSVGAHIYEFQPRQQESKDGISDAFYPHIRGEGGGAPGDHYAVAKTE